MLKYPITITLAVLMLTLFDSNPWWLVVLVAALATAINQQLAPALAQSIPRLLLGLLQGIVVALLAYLVGLTPYFRTTLGTLVGLVVVITLAESIAFKKIPSRNP